VRSHETAFVDDSSDYSGDRKAALGLGPIKQREQLPNLVERRRVLPESNDEVVGVESHQRRVSRDKLIVGEPVQTGGARDLASKVDDIDRVLVRLTTFLLRVPGMGGGLLSRPFVDEREDPRLHHLNSLGIGLVPYQGAERAENRAARNRCVTMVEGEFEGVAQLSFASGKLALHPFKFFFSSHRLPVLCDRRRFRRTLRQMGSATPNSSRSFATERTKP